MSEFVTAEDFSFHCAKCVGDEINRPASNDLKLKLSTEFSPRFVEVGNLYRSDPTITIIGNRLYQSEQSKVDKQYVRYNEQSRPCNTDMFKRENFTILSSAIQKITQKDSKRGKLSAV